MKVNRLFSVVLRTSHLLCIREIAGASELPRKDSGSEGDEGVPYGAVPFGSCAWTMDVRLPVRGMAAQQSTQLPPPKSVLRSLTNRSGGTARQASRWC